MNEPAVCTEFVVLTPSETLPPESVTLEKLKLGLVTVSDPYTPLLVTVIEPFTSRLNPGIVSVAGVAAVPTSNSNPPPWLGVKSIRPLSWTPPGRPSEMFDEPTWRLCTGIDAGNVTVPAMSPENPV